MAGDASRFQLIFATEDDIRLGFPCFFCQTRFNADPDRVNSVLVNKFSGLPTDTMPNGEKWEYTPKAMKDSEKFPICRDCAALIHRGRQMAYRLLCTQVDFENRYMPNV